VAVAVASSILVGCSSSVVAGGSASLTAQKKPAAGDVVVAEGPRAESAVVDGPGLTVNLTFIGSPQPIDRPCGEDYQATAKETASSVVVTIERRFLFRDDDLGCGAAGATRTAQLRLRQALGERSLVDVHDLVPIKVKTAGAASSSS